MPSKTLLEALAEMPDPRGRKGLIHPLPAVMGPVVLAMLMGRTSLIGIARFGRQYGHTLAWALGFRRGKTPAVSTLCRTLRRFDAERLEAILADWISSRISPEAFDQIGIDGKTLRGSRDGEIPGVHLVAAYAHRVRAVLGQVRVDAETDEHKAAPGLLGIVPVAGRVVVGDAAFCQRDLAAAVIEAGGDYVLTVEENQKSLEIDIGAGMAYEDSARRLAAAAPPLRRDSGRYEHHRVLGDR